MLENFPSRGFQSSISNRLHFGIGNIDKVDSVMVYWPNNKISNYANLKTNTLHKIKFDDQNVENFKIKKYSNSTHKLKETELFEFKHTENKFIDFNKERLLTQMYSNEGPALAYEDINNDGSANGEIIIYPDSHHSFDSSRELTFNEGAYSVDDCELIVTDNGSIYTKNEGFPMTTPILQRIGLFLCAERGTHWGYSDPKMGAKSIDDASSFMINHLINN